MFPFFLSTSVSLENAWFCTNLITVFDQGLTNWYSRSYLLILLVHFILNFRTTAMTLFILSQSDIFSNLVMFSLISTKFTLHFTSGSLISNMPISCLWFHESFSGLKKAGPSNHCFIFASLGILSPIDAESDGLSADLT